MLLRLLSFAVFLFAAPSAAYGCSCMSPRARGQPWEPRLWTERPFLFVGHALEVEETRTQSPRLTVRLVTEASWRGPMPDTVTLIVRADAPCAEYIAGGRYLIVADHDSGSALATAPCDDSWNIHFAGPRLAQLGAPRWVAPPMGGRTLDALAVHLGEAAPPRLAPDSLVLVVPSDSDMARFEIADWAGPANQSQLHLKPGLYQFRITWTDGTSYTSYLSLRCERRTIERPCDVFRFFSYLRPAA